MLLDKEIQLSSKYNYDLEYYKNLGYETSVDFFIVKIDDLPKKSFTKVNVKCEYCDLKELIPYCKWNRSMNSIVKKYCCRSCKGEKIKESNLVKYGVTSVAKLESSKEKSKTTNLKKRGVEFHTQSKEVKDKIRKTNLKNLGVENPMQSENIKNKQRESIVEIYGVDNISKLDYIKNKKKETTFLNFGVDSPLKSDEIKNKVKNTNLKNFGNEYFTKNEIYRKENYDIANDHFYLKYIKDGISLFNCDYGLEHTFEIHKDVYNKRKLYNVGLCTFCNPISDNRSIKEKELFNFISNLYKGEIVNNYRDGKMEIDIYLPSLNLGFEFNGLYWHSNIYKEKYFHYNKSSYFSKRGIRIIHIWEDQWDFKRDIVCSQISNLLNFNNRIFARKCHVREIENISCKEFLEKSHIQGNVNSIIKLGLYRENDELVSVMTFDHFEGRNKMNDNEWNINRFCNKLGYNVIGGASKLLTYFTKNYDVRRIISYADKDWSLGNLYNKLEFSLIIESEPDYKYILDNKRVHKSRFRKSRTNISESNLLIPKIWDCGKLKFEKIYY
jgi:hypothetical protein